MLQEKARAAHHLIRCAGEGGVMKTQLEGKGKIEGERRRKGRKRKVVHDYAKCAPPERKK